MEQLRIVCDCGNTKWRQKDSHTIECPQCGASATVKGAYL